MLDSGFLVEIYSVKDNDKFKGYKTLAPKKSYKTDLDFAMANAVDNIIAFLNGNEKLLCTLEDGYKAIKYA